MEQWQAFIGELSNKKYRISDSTYPSLPRFSFSFDKISELSSAKTVLVTYYLIKYTDTPSPVLEPYLELNVDGADCVYLKLIDSRGAAPLLASNGGGDFVTLSISGKAACK